MVFKTVPFARFEKSTPNDVWSVVWSLRVAQGPSEIEGSRGLESAACALGGKGTSKALDVHNSGRI